MRAAMMEPSINSASLPSVRHLTADSKPQKRSTTSARRGTFFGTYVEAWRAYKRRLRRGVLTPLRTPLQVLGRYGAGFAKPNRFCPKQSDRRIAELWQEQPTVAPAVTL